LHVRRDDRADGPTRRRSSRCRAGPRPRGPPPLGCPATLQGSAGHSATGPALNVHTRSAWPSITSRRSCRSASPNGATIYSSMLSRPSCRPKNTRELRTIHIRDAPVRWCTRSPSTGHPAALAHHPSAVLSGAPEVAVQRLQCPACPPSAVAPPSHRSNTAGPAMPKPQTSVRDGQPLFERA